jgi:hypothetical protein
MKANCVWNEKFLIISPDPSLEKRGIISPSPSLEKKGVGKGG